jgi:hypothetical protein
LADPALPALKRLIKNCPAKTRHKFGSRHTGWEVTLPSGVTAYIIIRRHHQIYRDGKLTITAALTEDVASWMIEHAALRMVQKRGLEWIIIFVVNTGEYYAAPIATWLDKTKTTDLDTRADRVRHLGIQHMTRRQVDIPFDKLMR